jgi:bifunctional UDP-N-acetylglucosamine pyrophosphorylase / glucosamine-1-phosphate N-acetyltransferase
LLPCEKAQNDKEIVMGLKIVILAAGKGKRMVSSISKVLHPLGGIPLLQRVVNTAQTLEPDNIYVVYGNGGTHVRETLSHLPVEWIKQDKQLGTGHAVSQAMPAFDDSDNVLVLYGDVPLITTSTLKKLLKDTPRNGLGLMITEFEDPTGFGRIIRNEMSNIVAIVEEKDATPAQRRIKEINTGIISVPALLLKSWLPELKNDNKQQEYYLTDIVALAEKNGHSVGGIMAHCHEEVRGVNDRWQLEKLERHHQRLQAKALAYSGVTVADPARIDVRGELETGTDIFIDVNAVIEGTVKIGSHCHIGPNVMIKDTTIEDHVTILANSVLDGAVIKEGANIGPFARLRSGTVIEKNAKIGNFVETKNTILGEGSKASHLTYLGDATIGKDVNIGAGTITCNYDGVNKWPTTIGDAVFIGSNSSLVAPIKIGNNATIGAGSSITEDAPANQLTLSRAKQNSAKGWQRPTKRQALNSDNKTD